MFPVMLMMMMLMMMPMVAIMVKIYLLSKLVRQIQHVWFMSSVDTDDGDDDDGSNKNDNVPAVQTHTADAVHLVHV